MKITITFLILLLSFTSYSQLILVNGNRYVVASTIAKFNMSKTTSITSGWTNCTASGGFIGSQTFTDPGTGWQLVTNGSQWERYYGGTEALTNGDGGTSAGGSPTYDNFPATVMANGWLQAGRSYATYSATFPIEIRNLPAGTYTVEVTGTLKGSVNTFPTDGIWYMKFGTNTVSNQTLTSQVDNTNRTRTFDATSIFTQTGLSNQTTITTGQYIYIGPYTLTDNASDGTTTIVTGIIITKTS